MRDEETKNCLFVFVGVCVFFPFFIIIFLSLSLTSIAFCLLEKQDFGSKLIYFRIKSINSLKFIQFLSFWEFECAYMLYVCICIMYIYMHVTHRHSEKLSIDRSRATLYILCGIVGRASMFDIICDSFTLFFLFYFPNSILFYAPLKIKWQNILWMFPMQSVKW